MASYFELLMRIQRGDEQAKNDLYEEFCSRIKKLCRHPRYEEVESDLNEFFAKLIIRMNLQKFSGANNKQIAGYIHRCLNNEIRDLYKKYKKRKVLILQ